jgi:O-antigen/teichoic acid export membrane protein
MAKLRSHLAINLLTRVFGLVSGAAVVIIQTRMLGKADFGRFSTIFALLNLSILFSDLGLQNWLTRQVLADSHQKEKLRQSLTQSVITLRVSLSVMATLIAVVIARAIFPDTQTFISATLVLVSNLFGFMGVLFVRKNAKLDYWGQNIYLLLQSLIWLVISLLLLFFKSDLRTLCLAFFINIIIQALLILPLTSSARFSKLQINKGSILLILHSSWPLLLASAFVAIYYRGIQIIVYQCLGASWSSTFGLALRMLDVLQLVPAVVITPLLALLKRAHSSQHLRFLNPGTLSLRILLLYSVSMAGVLYLLPDSFYQVILNQKNTHEISVLRFMLLSIVPISIGWVVTTIIIHSGVFKSMALVTGLTVLFFHPLMWITAFYGTPHHLALEFVLQESSVVSVLYLSLSKEKKYFVLAGKKSLIFASLTCVMLVAMALMHEPIEGLKAGIFLFLCVALAYIMRLFNFESFSHWLREN